MWLGRPDHGNTNLISSQHQASNCQPMVIDGNSVTTEILNLGRSEESPIFIQCKQLKCHTVHMNFVIEHGYRTKQL